MVVTQHGKAIRSTWPRVRIEYKNDKIGYLVDARGNGWKGQDRFYFGEKAKALKKSSRDCKALQRAWSGCCQV